MTVWNWRILCFGLMVFSLAGCDLSRPDERGVSVVKYEGPPITEEEVGGHWQSQVDTLYGQVVLTAVGPDSVEEARLALQDVPGELPAFIGYISRPGTEWSASFISGTLYIQSFELHGEVSGKIEGRLTMPQLGAITGGTFWVNLSPNK